MKNIKKIIAVILAVATLMCAFSFTGVSAKNYEQSDENVAVMYLGYRDGAKRFEGHAFLYFKNITDHEITVGLYPVPAGGAVSVGTFGTMIDGTGLYYNVEAFRYNHFKLTNYISLSKYVTEDQLEDVSEKITKSGFWNKFFNCTYFALTTWNEVPGQKMIWLIFPELTNIQIKSYSTHQGYFAMIKPSESNVFKQIGDGKDAQIVPASWHMDLDFA